MSDETLKTQHRFRIVEYLGRFFVEKEVAVVEKFKKKSYRQSWIIVSRIEKGEIILHDEGKKHDMCASWFGDVQQAERQVNRLFELLRFKRDGIKIVKEFSEII